MVEPAHAVPVPEPMPMPQYPPVAAGLVAPEAAAAAASSVGGLVRALATERSVQVRNGGPTLEDLVREEIRPMLKEWLDINLPPLVERLVRYRDRTRRRPRRTLSPIVIVGLLRHPRGAAGERDAG